MTELDTAHAAMQQGGGGEHSDDAARLQFYQKLADAELFVLLDREADGEVISPELFEVEQGRFVLAFDLEERLAEFTGRVAPYAAVSGRVLVQMLDGPGNGPENGSGIGLGVNLGVAPSSILIPADAVGWLNRTLGQVPDRVEARIAGFVAPDDLPGVLVAALAAKLASAAGLAQAAWLVGVQYEGGGRGHMLGFVGAHAGVQDALAKATGEALTFAGIGAGGIDVGFFAVDDPVVAKLAATGVCVDLPPAPPARPVQTPPRAAPGSDPDKPPILK